MNWLTKFVKPKLKAIKSKILKKENLWLKCPSCGQMNFHKDLDESMYTCTNCQAHLYMPVKKMSVELNVREVTIKRSMSRLEKHKYILRRRTKNFSQTKILKR